MNAAPTITREQVDGVLAAIYAGLTDPSPTRAQLDQALNADSIVSVLTGAGWVVSTSSEQKE
jgi:hypothetical protein